MLIFRTLLLLLFGTFGLTGCMKYQYATVNSSLSMNERQEYFLENDSLLISYSFQGYGGPVRISIYNKLDVPLYVSWKRSALVLNDQSNTYWQNQSRLQATAQGTQFSFTPVVSSSVSAIDGVIKGEDAYSFIAPNAYMQTNMVMVDPNYTALAPAQNQQRVEINTAAGPVRAMRYAYRPEDSPLKFRSYLTLSADPDFKDEFVYESEFWVGEILQTGVKPEYYLRGEGNQNKFYKSKTTGFGMTLGVLGILVLLVFSVAGAGA